MDEFWCVPFSVGTCKKQMPMACYGQVVVSTTCFLESWPLCYLCPIWGKFLNDCQVDNHGWPFSICNYVLTIAFLEWSWKPMQNQPKITKNRGKHNNQLVKKTPCNKASNFFFITNLDTTLWETSEKHRSPEMPKKVLWVFCLGNPDKPKEFTHTSHISAIHLKGIYCTWSIWYGNFLCKRKSLRSSTQQPRSLHGTSYTSNQGSWTNSLAKKPAGFCSFSYVGVSKNRGTPKWMVYNGNPY